ncbi:uncharacterized protein [Triticum aestivum]|uniref:uncharacterized protein n=1 Tax=Triticum aestivum TaxID=4565 RepID=UPI001D011CEE|nr:uncharacterized protein LOC123170520 [Triticum aestivum]
MFNPANPSYRWEKGCAPTSARSSSPPRGETAPSGSSMTSSSTSSPASPPSRSAASCASPTMSGFFYGRTITEDHEWLPGPPVHFTSAPGRCGLPIDTSCAFLPNHRRVDLLDCCNILLLCRWYGLSAEASELSRVQSGHEEVGPAAGLLLGHHTFGLESGCVVAFVCV